MSEKLKLPYKANEYVKWLRGTGIPFIRIDDTKCFLIMVARGDYHYLTIEFQFMGKDFFDSKFSSFKVSRQYVESTEQAVKRTVKYLNVD